MELLNLFAQIQSNPRNANAYRGLIDYYESHNMANEAEAFKLLLNKQLHGSNNTANHTEQ